MIAEVLKSNRGKFALTPVAGCNKYNWFGLFPVSFQGLKWGNVPLTFVS